MRTFIYFIRDAEFVKIGFSDDPNKRLAALQTANPRRLEILGVFPGGEEDEKRLHSAFEQFHIRNEWFFYAETIRRFAETHCYAYTSDVVSFDLAASAKQDGGEFFLNWLKSNIVAESGARASVDACYKGYCRWCYQSEVLPLRRSIFGTRMSNYLHSVNGAPLKIKGVLYYTGIRFHSDVISPRERGGKRTSRADAKRWLRNFLKNGPKSASEVGAAAKLEGISHGLLCTIREQVGVIAIKTSHRKNVPAIWSLEKEAA